MPEIDARELERLVAASGFDTTRPEPHIRFAEGLDYEFHISGGPDITRTVHQGHVWPELRPLIEFLERTFDAFSNS